MTNAIAQPARRTWYPGKGTPGASQCSLGQTNNVAARAARMRAGA